MSICMELMRGDCREHVVAWEARNVRFMRSKGRVALELEVAPWAGAGAGAVVYFL